MANNVTRTEGWRYLVRRMYERKEGVATVPLSIAKPTHRSFHSCDYGHDGCTRNLVNCTTLVDNAYTFDEIRLEPIHQMWWYGGTLTLTQSARDYLVDTVI